MIPGLGKGGKDVKGSYSLSGFNFFNAFSQTPPRVKNGMT